MSPKMGPDWFYATIKGWSEVHLRSFPWRETDDPYKVFLAECLLKRTTSTAALRVYGGLIEKYPDIFSLASAHNIEEDLRPVGLYKQRGKLILQAASYITVNLHGSFPRNAKELAGIPGIGEYAASAISSFAFGQPVPTVDSNVMRVLGRFLGNNDLKKTMASSYLSEAIRGKESRRFNLGIIDLGSTVCRPLRPNCGGCPLAPSCQYLKNKSKLDMS